MSVNYRIKEVLKKSGISMMKFASIRGVAFQSVSRKVNHGSFTLEQLNEVARITGCKVECSFVFPDGSKIFLHEKEMEGDEIMVVDYCVLLSEKVQDEYNKFITDLNGMTTKDAIDHAYEKVIKEDLVACIEGQKLDNSEAKALYLKKQPLDYCYQEWLKNDFSYSDMLRDTVDDACKRSVKEMKEKHKERG